MARKKHSLFEDGVIDVHFIDIDNIPEDNASIYENMIYEAINYAENNTIVEAYLPGEYINLRNEKTYVDDLKDVISTLNSMALHFAL